MEKEYLPTVDETIDFALEYTRLRGTDENFYKTVDELRSDPEFLSMQKWLIDAHSEINVYDNYFFSNDLHLSQRYLNLWTKALNNYFKETSSIWRKLFRVIRPATFITN